MYNPADLPTLPTCYAYDVVTLPSEGVIGFTFAGVVKVVCVDKVDLSIVEFVQVIFFGAELILRALMQYDVKYDPDFTHAH